MIVRRINDEPFDKPSVPGSRAVTIKFMIPNSRMGSIIGKQGTKIKEIQDALMQETLASGLPFLFEDLTASARNVVIQRTPRKATSATATPATSRRLFTQPEPEVEARQPARRQTSKGGSSSKVTTATTAGTTTKGTKGKTRTGTSSTRSRKTKQTIPGALIDDEAGDQSDGSSIHDEHDTTHEEDEENGNESMDRVPDLPPSFGTRGSKRRASSITSDGTDLIGDDDDGEGPARIRRRSSRIAKGDNDGSGDAVHKEKKPRSGATGTRGKNKSKTSIRVRK